MEDTQPKSKCMRCGGRPGDTRQGRLVRFAKLAKNGKWDSLCIDCRFLVIDTRAGDLDGIREDMLEIDIPLTRYPEDIDR